MPGVRDEAVVQKSPARQLVLDLLERSTLKVRVAAVVSDRHGRIISWGWNHGYVHAEEHALSRANPKRIPGSTVTVAGRRRSGNWVLGRPCTKKGKNCLGMIFGRGVLKVEYLDKEGGWREEP